jgi:hypothetical protein
VQLQGLQAHDGEPAKGKKRSRARNTPKFDLRAQLLKMCGVDLTRIDGIDVTTVLAVISEPGVEMNARNGRAGCPSTSCGGTSAPRRNNHGDYKGIPYLTGCLIQYVLSDACEGN